MAVKSIISEINDDVLDVLRTKFEYINTVNVPNASDGVLTYESGKEKTGKNIETCVLYVDIRNSVELTKDNSIQLMGRLYTAFTKGVLKAAKHHSGHIRNIIGDRIMIVFPKVNCFTNAVDCAISINHISKFIINKHFSSIDFKCGIGIDYGELKVIKVGLHRKGEEHGVNKGLVWVGQPANIASRLTDIANKSIEEIYFKVTRNPNNPNRFPFGLIGFLGYNLTTIGKPKVPNHNAPYYLETEETIEMSSEEFLKDIYVGSNGQFDILSGKFIRFSKEKRKVDYSPILMTKKVYDGFKLMNAERNSIKEKFWNEQKHKIKNVTDKIYGGDLYWEIN